MELGPRDRALDHQSPRAPRQGKRGGTLELTVQTGSGVHLTEAVIEAREVVSMILEAGVTVPANGNPLASRRGQRIQQPRKLHMAK